MMMFNLLIAIPWTIIITLFLCAEYKTNKKFDWFQYPDIIFNYISHIMFHVTFGILIWFNVFILLTLFQFISFIALGTLFLIISMVFRSIHTNRLNKEMKRLIRKWEQR